MSEIDPEKPPKPEADDDARPLTGEPVAPTRLRAEPPRVTRLSRKVLASLGLVGSLSIGGALIPEELRGVRAKDRVSLRLVISQTASPMTRRAADRPQRRLNVVSGILPDDLYDYIPQDDIETPAPRIGRPPKHEVESWTVTDDWPDRVPVTEAEIDLFEAWFGDILDELFGPSQ